MHSLYWIFKARNNMEDSDFLRSFHELLVKQMFGQAKFSYALEKILNPFLGNQNVTTLENEQRNLPSR